MLGGWTPPAITLGFEAVGEGRDPKLQSAGNARVIPIEYPPKSIECTVKASCMPPQVDFSREIGVG